MYDEAQKKGLLTRMANGICRVTAAEWNHSIQEVKGTKFNAGLALALACVFIVILGNVILLIAINFWLSIFPEEELVTNSSQIAVQVIVCVMLVVCFLILGIAFLIYFGFAPLWRALTDKNRVRGPLYRLLLLFASGATNGLTGVLAVYAMSHTPEFVQAVLLSAIPFCAQAWTYALIPEERERRYLSLTFIAAFVLAVAGVLLSSLSSFLNKNETGKVAPWDWALVYLASAVVFGLWCVVQRLYLDAVLIVGPQRSAEAAEGPAGSPVATANEAEGQDTTTALQVDACESRDGHVESSLEEPLLAQKRTWGKQNEDDFAAKTTLLLVGIFFQTLVSFVCLPVDVLPWFGTSKNMADAWKGFSASCDFMFASWENIRYGLLHTLGFFMSFIGCVYLNERSPTLASVVLQLAGPVTGIVLIIVPQWDVYGSHGVVGQKVGGVILLVIAGLMYHIWDQASFHELVERKKNSAQVPPNAEEGEAAMEVINDEKASKN